eukprot:5792433-Alexandrium_andersonii.AAC.1
MSASLVGSEMCIRDRLAPQQPWLRQPAVMDGCAGCSMYVQPCEPGRDNNCLLYTSDAADDM